jgi:hypothetical protein
VPPVIVTVFVVENIKFVDKFILISVKASSFPTEVFNCNPVTSTLGFI